MASQEHGFDRDAPHTHHMLYTSNSTLALGTGTAYYPPFGGLLVTVRINVATAPVASAFQVDVLLDSVGIFGSGVYAEVAASATVGSRKASKLQYFRPDQKLQFQIISVASATGPFVADLEYLPA